jgi:hypothetical protein
VPHAWARSLALPSRTEAEAEAVGVGVTCRDETRQAGGAVGRTDGRDVDDSLIVNIIVGC